MDVEREISTSFAIVRIRDQSEENLQLLLGKLKIIPIFLPFSDTFARSWPKGATNFSTRSKFSGSRCANVRRKPGFAQVF